MKRKILKVANKLQKATPNQIKYTAAEFPREISIAEILSFLSPLRLLFAAEELSAVLALSSPPGAGRSSRNASTNSTCCDAPPIARPAAKSPGGSTTRSGAQQRGTASFVLATSNTYVRPDDAFIAARRLLSDCLMLLVEALSSDSDSGVGGAEGDDMDPDSRPAGGNGHHASAPKFVFFCESCGHVTTHRIGAFPGRSRLGMTSNVDPPIAASHSPLPLPPR